MAGKKSAEALATKRLCHSQSCFALIKQLVVIGVISFGGAASSGTRTRSKAVPRPPRLADDIDFDTFLDEYSFPPLNLYAGLDDPPAWRGCCPPGSQVLASHRTFTVAANIGFYDGHADLIKLEQLWQLNWRKDYTVPATRLGLPLS